MILRSTALALTLLIAPPAPAAETRIDVAMSNFKFTPDTIRMKAGQAYVLHLTSTGGHSFGAATFFAAAKIAPADRAKISKGKIEVGAGQPVDIHLTAPAAGSYPVRCTHFLHASFGMTGKIVVS
ncbi:plastocyanin/azurin family copper-binding protein [Sphingomonas sp. LB-2]|uniref:plastocyanin/azurin family copper-binding protein n=1 Tax=Sphingomonas caeni TaxID=2984949 RepID=UPI00222E518B|nr:plastocyanin/azurin family copper-binding protein [Sphingomonas caeni]MCW3845897.1 plastocyanin/azurin family copper-binding protein [Sphingomonas caeni]